MNERIKELIPRPWTFPYPDREMYSREQMEHLAELIVQECAEISENYAGGSMPVLIACAIKEHFGVA
jgi:hypothetical protein